MEHLPQIERILADDEPFGSSSYILSRMIAHYRHRLQMVADDLPDLLPLWLDLTGRNKDASLIVLGNPAVRIAIDSTLRELKFGTLGLPREQACRLLRLAIQLRWSDTVFGPRMRHASPRVCLPFPQIWHLQGAPEDEFRRVFLRSFTKYHSGLDLVTPDMKSQENLEAGAQLLGDLLPYLFASALDHVQLVAFVQAASAKFSSLTNPHIPGTIFLSSSVCTDPWRAAEYLLHEALHVKFVDLEHTHSLMSSTYRSEISPKIRPLWNRPYPGNTNQWSVNRSLTVMHVYTCLALFFLSVSARHSALERLYGPLRGLDPAAQARRALDRAGYIGRQLELHSEFLGFGGRCFLRWLRQIGDVLDTQPCRSKSDIHLLRDLYMREIEEIRQLSRGNVSGFGPSRHSGKGGVGKAITDILADEITTVGEILDGERRRSFLERASVTMADAGCEGELDGATRAFATVRELIVQELDEWFTGHVASENRQVRRSIAPEEIIGGMIERSGQRLNPLLEAV